MSNLFTPFERMRGIAQTDVTELEEAGKSYGDSWKRRSFGFTVSS